MPCFCTSPGEDLDDAQKKIKEHMRIIIHEIKCVSVRGFSEEELLKDVHKLMDHMFYGKCDGNWWPIID
jgi:hypothetical protein